VSIAVHEQLGEVVSLAHDIWNRYYPSIISQGQIDYMLRLRYTPDTLTDRFHRRGTTILIAWLGSNAIGFAVLAIPDDELDEVKLDAFYLHPDHHRRGLGHLFMKQVINHLRHQSRRTVVLNVNRRNIAAINFYFRQGFTIRSAVDVDLGNGYVGDDFVMARTFAT
jgi:diamine N-acetyltransferase